ncbi:MAG: hypothetical protein IT345_10705 [Trueperaceae bacterium]|nr:hypothetical protein [Trueperaceae bacterium]
MAAFSDYLEDALVDHIFRGTAFTAPTTIFVSLHSADPTDAGGSEVTGTSYARVGVTSGTAAWAATSGTNGLTDNLAAITFPQAGGTWGTVTHVGLYDAASAGNLLFGGALAASKAIGTNDTFEFAIGDLDITLA